MLSLHEINQCTDLGDLTYEFFKEYRRFLKKRGNENLYEFYSLAYIRTLIDRIEDIENIEFHETKKYSDGYSTEYDKSPGDPKF